MSTTLRMLREALLPVELHNWLARMNEQDRLRIVPTNGAAGHCFNMYDLHFVDEADAVLFKLTFSQVPFTDAEVALTDLDDTNGPNADKSRLWEAKMALYQKMKREA